MELDKHQKALNAYLNKHAVNNGLTRQYALLEILGDLEIIARETGLDFYKALLGGLTHDPDVFEACIF